MVVGIASYKAWDLSGFVKGRILNSLRAVICKSVRVEKHGATKLGATKLGVQ